MDIALFWWWVPRSSVEVEVIHSGWQSSKAADFGGDKRGLPRLKEIHPARSVSFTQHHSAGARLRMERGWGATEQTPEARALSRSPSRRDRGRRWAPFAAVYPHTPVEIEKARRDRDWPRWRSRTAASIPTLATTEFDQLTDIHNRFSLDKQMEAQITPARRENASIFGLIYVDLDEFKQVNDQYPGTGWAIYICRKHPRRMKRQLRSADLLARIGGDEFAVLFAMVHNRSEVEEIALRLDNCFAAPYMVEGCAIHGSATRHRALPRRWIHQGQPAERRRCGDVCHQAYKAARAQQHKRTTTRRSLAAATTEADGADPQCS